MMNIPGTEDYSEQDWLAVTNYASFAHLWNRLVELRSTSGMSPQEVATLLNISSERVDQLEGSNRGSDVRTSTIVSYAAAVGARIEIKVMSNDVQILSQAHSTVANLDDYRENRRPFRPQLENMMTVRMSKAEVI